MKALLPIRRLIPRWRRISSTLVSADSVPRISGVSPPKSAVNTEGFSQAIQEWNKDPTAGRLGEILAFAIADNFRPQVAALAQEALSQPQLITTPQRLILEGLIGAESLEEDVSVDVGICNPHVRDQVQEARRILRINPANPLTLLDYAQLQLASGKSKQAERTLRGALALSPNSRTVLRTVARFEVHAGRPDVAHDMLVRHQRTPFDAWLMASEIAVSQAAGTSSRFFNKAWKLARDKGADRADISELAGAVGGVELASGKMKNARDFFRIALMSPNDNVIAQAVTDHLALGLALDAPAQRHAVVGAAEARTLVAWESMDIGAAEACALKWHAEEPFSSRPLHFLTALYASSGRHTESVSLCRRGLLADPKEGGLLANLSYALACLGSLEESEKASKFLQKFHPGEYDGQIAATRGLVMFKRGDFEAGDALYAQALAIFERTKNLRLRALCYAYYFRAAFDLNHPNVEDIAHAAVEAYRQAPSLDAAYLYRKIREEITAPPPEPNLRQLGQWIYDADRNLLIRKEGVTAPGAPLLITKGRTS